MAKKLLANSLDMPSWPVNNSLNRHQLLDLETIQDDFVTNQRRLLIDDDDLNVTLLELGADQSVRRRQLDSSASCLSYIKQPRPESTTTILLIHQTFSWGELEISSVGLQALFHHLEISAGFWSALKLFGCKENDNTECAGGFNEEIRSDEDDSFELSYVVKHAEEHDREEQHDPWSIRQIGVAHKYDAASKNNVFILLNPSDVLARRINSATSTTQGIDMHRLILAAVTERWGLYLAYLEGLVGDIGKRAVLSHAPRGSQGPGYEIRLEDSQRIQKRQDTILRVSHMLDLNHSVFENILNGRDLLTNTTLMPGVVHNSRRTISNISTLETQTRTYKLYTENLLRRLDGASILIRSILDAQALEALQASSQLTSELAKLAQDDAKKATKAARNLGIITLLGFIYLPAGFVGTLLGTQYITVHTNDINGGVSIRFASEMWIFLVLTALLLIITAGLWLCFQRHARLTDRAATIMDRV